MVISNKQLLVMFEILRWSVNVSGLVAGLDQETRIKIVNQIINQQSEKLKEIE